MKILIVENYAGTTAGLVGQAIREAGGEMDLRQMHAGDDLPADSSGHDGIVVLGGGQNALADEEHPYLPHLARLTKIFGDDGKAVLGICLGSQIVARGYGGTNIIGRPIEIGWQPVWPSEAGKADPVLSQLPPGAAPFHWHSDTFLLPPDAVHLAQSARTPNQAFRIGKKVYAIQFHFEADQQIVENWTGAYGALLKDGAEHWPQEWLAVKDEAGPAADRVGLDLARAWVRLVREPVA